MGSRPASRPVSTLPFGMDGSPALEFQPAVDLDSGRLLGFEALVRWDHPTRGRIPPVVLIPWAEANDRIVELNAWVLAEATRQAARWPSGIQLAVNCSLTELRRQRASLAVADALERSGLNPDRLTVEITEPSVADERAAEDLRTVCSFGVHLAVDDVGTSWTTLENLRRFAIETAKIDRAFISALEPREGMNRAIVEAIIHVSHSLAMSTVAEGVETAEQVQTLQAFGADVAQGFFFAGPLSAQDAHALAGTEPRATFSLTPSPTEDEASRLQPLPLVVLPGGAMDEAHPPLAAPAG